MILLLLLLHLSVNRWSLFVESSIVFGNQQRRRDFTEPIWIFVHYVNLSFEMFNCLFIKGRECNQLSLHSSNAYGFSLCHSELRWMHKELTAAAAVNAILWFRCVCIFQSKIYDACRHIMSFMCAQEWMNGWDIKDQGQCETNNIFQFLLNVCVCLADKFFIKSISCFYKKKKLLLKICNNCKNYPEKQV